jgi:hypothetical protein
VWVVGRCERWHVEQVIVVVWTRVLGVQFGYLWHCSQTVVNFCVLAVWVVGLSARWHDWQLVVEVVCVYVTAVHDGNL